MCFFDNNILIGCAYLYFCTSNETKVFKNSFYHHGGGAAG